MNDDTRARNWLRLAVIYFALGVLLGVTMGASGDHSLFPLHAHINLLGWVSMTLFGLIGKAFPQVARGRLASAHFWLYNLALPVLVVALGWRLKGHPEAEPVLGIASVAVGVAVLLFALQALLALRAGRPASLAASAKVPA
jgi:hypothetical protein